MPNPGHNWKPHEDALQVTDPRLAATECFWPYRMHPLAAVMGQALLPFLPAWASTRQRNHALLCEWWDEAAPCQMIKPETEDEGAWGGLTLRYDASQSPGARQAYAQRLRHRGIPLALGPVRVPLHYRPEVTARWGNQEPCPVAERYCDKEELFLRDTIGWIESAPETGKRLSKLLCCQLGPAQAV